MSNTVIPLSQALKLHKEHLSKYKMSGLHYCWVYNIKIDYLIEFDSKKSDLFDLTLCSSTGILNK